MTTCRECKSQVSTKAPTCPHCGAPTPSGLSPKTKKVLVIGAGVFVATFAATHITLRQVIRESYLTFSTTSPSSTSGTSSTARASSALPVTRSSARTRTYSERDFIWDSVTSKYKSDIVAGVNRVAKEVRECKSIDTSSAYVSSSRSTPNQPVFFVTCNDRRSAFNVFFTASRILR